MSSSRSSPILHRSPPAPAATSAVWGWGGSRVCSRSVERFAVAVVGRALVALALCAGCNDSVTLEIASDRPVPQAIDSICVGLADTSMSGGHFGRSYRLEDGLAHLPQTLRV